MPLEIREALTESDALRIATIERDAYLPNPFNPILFPGPLPDDALQRRAAELVRNKNANPINTKWFTVVDTDIVPGDVPGGEGMISFAQWVIIYNNPPTKPGKEGGETKEATTQKRETFPWANAAACDALFGGLAKLREEIMGSRNHIYFSYLQTDPKHERRGAGGMLLKACVEEGERLGLPVLLTSSPAGRPLYVRNGFTDVKKFELDFAQWGLDKVQEVWAMIREPQ
ncbi:hypothetical protein QBC46DRAFT_382701 [Diplogelasinospora grovesii]|uniref:N-acetyltransferase domain-containing protein n=1 Tax=Diplogelasinospora grovesii TaxID=303347 RepID=A0AAN6N9S9_9PEZI|nr:hypothetical protein QBC46DRAFT_382701 [Diplogelasinospora grovesii]